MSDSLRRSFIDGVSVGKAKILPSNSISYAPACHWNILPIAP
jgi:hypothetical protein